MCVLVDDVPFPGGLFCDVELKEANLREETQT